MHVGWKSWRSFSATAALVTVLSACIGTTPKAPQALEVGAVDGVQMAYVHQGRPGAAPAVVFQSGLGDDHGSWRQVLQQLPTDLEALAPDRPGYGASPAHDGTRDACSIAREQHALLRQSGAKPPYVLVGHSIGGLYQYVYARLYPQEVAGLVLLDATHPRMLDTLQREQPGTAALLQLARHTVFSAAAGQEFDAQTACLDGLDIRAPLAMPAVVLTSTKPAAYAGAELQDTLKQLQHDWLARTGAAVLTPVADSGHQIQRDAPDAVVRAIMSLTRSAAPDS